MLLAALALALLANLPGPAPTPAPPPDAPLNAVIGDAGFIARHGRAPTAADSDVERIRAHLAYVTAGLRAASASIADPAVRLRRDALIDALDGYAAAGAFPHNTAYAAPRRPVFIDEDGNLCAVGYLVAVSVGRDAAERIAAEHRYDFVADIDDEALDRWAVDHGFTATELATIQPSYHWEHPLPPRPAPPRPAPPAPEPAPIAPIELEPAPIGRGLPALAFLTPGAIEAARLGTYVDADGTANHVFASRGVEHLVRLDHDGVVIGSGRFDGTTLRWRAWYPSGKLAAIGKYESGVPDGAWTIYAESGKVLARLRFQNGTEIRRRG